ncbi:MAG: glycogen-binding domain-containing protein [Desulfobacteraceae bacterium]|nr:glycogen-binding domain-containing protein [Desulfobacteraceae bacterium]
MKSQDRLLHNLLDGVCPEPGVSEPTGHEAERLALYREGLKRLEGHEEKAPDDFAARVMAALPDKPRLTWWERLGSFWPERRFWPIPALAGALALFVIVAGLNLIWPTRGKVLIPIVLDLYAPSAKQVELVGTFSDWMPREFRLKGPDAVGYWAIAIKLPPGRYEYAFLINGSRLVSDDDGEALRPDGFGHENSVLMIRRGMRQFEQRYMLTSSNSEVMTKNNQAKTAISLPGQNRGQWQAILNKGIAAGVQRRQLEKALVRLATANFSPDQARMILEPLFQDVQAGIHARHVLLKLQEGVLKKAPFDTLTSVARIRHNSFKKAKNLLARTGHEGTIETDQTLLDSTAFALESGQNQLSLHEVLTAGKGNHPNQIAAVIEAGESLHNAGLKQEPLKLIMKDCLEKDLESCEIEQVLRHVKKKLKEGLDHKTIRDELWV